MSSSHPYQGNPSLPKDTISSTESSSFLETIKSVFVRLGVKFGYYKKPQPHPDVLHDFHDGEEYYEFTCMTADDLPILVNNEPVTVSQPEDCSKYFATGEPEGHASLMEPPLIFTEVAREKFKSNSLRFSYVFELTP